MSFSLSFKTTDWGTRHAAIYGHEFGRIFKYGVALTLSLAIVIVSIDLQIQRLISRCEIPEGDTPRSSPSPNFATPRVFSSFSYYSCQTPLIFLNFSC